MADKSTIKALSDSNLASGQSGGIIAAGHREVNDAILDGEATVGTGATILFDSPFGRFYNSAAPSNAANISLDPTGALVGAVSAFYNDGTVEPTVSPQPEPAAGTWVSGEVNVYWFMWDGTNFTQNIQAKALLTLIPPTFTLASGSTPLTLDYGSVVHDSNATASVMEISSDQVDWYQVTAQEFTFGDITGTISAIDGNAFVAGTIYYVRLTDSASGYGSETTEHSAAASAIPVLSTPTIAIDSVGSGFIAITRTVEDPAATDGLLQYKLSTEPTVWTDSTYFVHGTDPTNQLGLTDGLEYDFRYKSTASGYTDSAFSNEVSGTPSVGYLNTKSGGFNGSSYLTSSANKTKFGVLSTAAGGDTPFSMVFWLKTAGVSATERVWCIQDERSPVASMVNAGMVTGEILYFLLTSTSAAGNYIQVKTSSGLPKDVWNCIILTYDGSSASSGMGININGVDDTVTVDDDLPYTNMGDWLQPWPSIGVSLNTGNPFTGLIDEYAIIHRELSGPEKTAIYNNGSPVDLSGDPDLLLYVRFEDNLNDLSPDPVTWIETGTITYSTDLP